MSNIFEHKLPFGKFNVFNDKPNIQNIVELNQVHGNTIAKFNGDLYYAESDGIIFDLKDINKYHFSIKTADCLPIVLLSKTKAIFIHAGWRGIHQEILLTDEVKSIQPYFAFIGPSIQKDSFEVTDEFKTHFPDSINFEKKENKLVFDLQQEAINQLESAYKNIAIENCAQCTFKQTIYNSYRRNKTNKRNWNILSI